MSKQYTSDVEDSRLDIEEPERTLGRRIVPQQVWRYGALIPGSPKKMSFSVPEIENGHLVSYAYFKDNFKTAPIVKKIEKLKLLKVEGAEAYQDDELKNLIGKEFDDDSISIDDSWQYVLYADTNKLSYGVGKPQIDSETGVLKFLDKAFAAAVENEDIFITFYKYVGATGFFGSNNGADLPFKDDIALIESAANDKIKAHFYLNGSEGDTSYILPKSGGHFIGRTMTTDEYGKTKAVSSNEGTVMLEENYQEIDWNIGLHNGGVWLPNGEVKTN